MPYDTIALEHELAELIASEAPDLSASELFQAARHFVDHIGVSLAGTRVPEFTRLLDLTGTLRGGAAQIPHSLEVADADARVWGTAHRAERREAGLLNAFAGHVHDFDDDEVEFAMAHVTVTALTSAIVCADGRPGITGRDVLTAYLVGLEVAMRIGEILNPGHYRRGWHASATLGSFAAASAAARLQRLPAPQVRHALGLCASFAAGIRANFGSDAKPLQVGLAVRNGLFAVEAAAAGMTSSPGSLLGPTGFASLFQEGRDPASIIASFGRLYRFLGGSMTIKAYPCCTATHTAIYSLLALRAEHGWSAEDIAQIICHIDPTVPGILVHDRPSNGMEAKFSMPYCLAAAALWGKVGIAQFTDASVADATIQATMAKVQVHCDGDLPKGPSGTSVSSRLEIVLTDGTVHRRFQEFVPGSANEPLSDAALKAKFVGCLAGIACPSSELLFDELLAVETCPSFTALLDRLPICASKDDRGRSGADDPQ